MSVGIVAIASLVVMPNHPNGRAPGEDAGVFFYVARVILDGGIPYRDVWDHKPPGVYFFAALGLLLAGPLGVWVIQLLALATASLASLRAMSSLGARAAVLGTLAWLAASPRLFLEDGRQSSPAELYALPLQFVALALFARASERTDARLQTVAIGALAGAAFLLKPTLGGIWIAMVIAFATLRPVDLPQRLGPLILGAFAVIAIGLAPFAIAGALPDLIDQVFRYNSAYAGFAPFSDRLSAIGQGLRLTLPSGLAAVAIVAWPLAAWNLHSVPPVVRLAVIALPIELALASLGRGYNYYFIPWLPAMGVLAAYAVSVVERKVRPRLAGLVLVGAGVLTCLVPAVLLLRLGLTHDSGVSRAAATYVQENSAPDDTVFIWGSRTEVLVLADRESPTRFLYQYAPLETRGYADPGRIDELLSDLERRRPVLIIDASSASFVTPPLDRLGMSSFVSPEPQYAPPPELVRILAYVESAYQQAGTIPETGWPVWRRR